MRNSPNRRPFNLRPASLPDLAAIAAIDAAAGAPDHAALAAELVTLGMSWIAEADGAAAGYALVSRRFFSRPFVELLAVDPTWWRQGLGRRLLACCEAAHEGDRLFTSTNRSNAPMRALLEVAGYVASGVIDNLDPGDPELVFVKFRLPA